MDGWMEGEKMCFTWIKGGSVEWSKGSVNQSDIFSLLEWWEKKEGREKGPQGMREGRNFMEKVYKLYQVSWKFQAQAVIKASLRLEWNRKMVFTSPLLSIPHPSILLLLHFLLLHVLKELWTKFNSEVTSCLGYCSFNWKWNREGFEGNACLNFPLFVRNSKCNQLSRLENSFLSRIPSSRGMTSLWASTRTGNVRVLSPPDSLQN